MRAPLSGTVARILVEEGQALESGDVIVVLEAMKMETEITAPTRGRSGRSSSLRATPSAAGSCSWKPPDRRHQSSAMRAPMAKPAASNQSRVGRARMTFLGSL